MTLGHRSVEYLKTDLSRFHSTLWSNYSTVIRLGSLSAVNWHVSRTAAAHAGENLSLRQCISDVCLVFVEIHVLHDVAERPALKLPSMTGQRKLCTDSER